jgi:hypothetical protein
MHEITRKSVYRLLINSLYESLSLMQERYCSKFGCGALHQLPYMDLLDRYRDP